MGQSEAAIICETTSFAAGKHHSKRPHLSGRQMWSFCWSRVRESNPTKTVVRQCFFSFVAELILKF